MFLGQRSIYSDKSVFSLPKREVSIGGMSSGDVADLLYFEKTARIHDADSRFGVLGMVIYYFDIRVHFLKPGGVCL